MLDLPPPAPKPTTRLTRTAAFVWKHSLTADDEEYLRPPGFKLAFSMPRLPKLTGLVASQQCTPALIDAATARNNQLEYLRKRAQQRQQRSLKPIETPPTQKVQEQGAHFTCERASVKVHAACFLCVRL